MPPEGQLGRLPRHSIFIFTPSTFPYNSIGPWFLSNPPESLSPHLIIFFPLYIAPGRDDQSHCVMPFSVISSTYFSSTYEATKSTKCLTKIKVYTKVTSVCFLSTDVPHAAFNYNPEEMFVKAGDVFFGPNPSKNGNYASGLNKCCQSAKRLKICVRVSVVIKPIIDATHMKFFHSETAATAFQVVIKLIINAIPTKPFHPETTSTFQVPFLSAVLRWFYTSVIQDSVHPYSSATHDRTGVVMGQMRTGAVTRMTNSITASYNHNIFNFHPYSSATHDRTSVIVGQMRTGAVTCMTNFITSSYNYNGVNGIRPLISMKVKIKSQLSFRVFNKKPVTVKAPIVTLNETTADVISLSMYIVSWEPPYLITLLCTDSLALCRDLLFSTYSIESIAGGRPTPSLRSLEDKNNNFRKLYVMYTLNTGSFHSETMTPTVQVMMLPLVTSLQTKKSYLISNNCINYRHDIEFKSKKYPLYIPYSISRCKDSFYLESRNLSCSLAGNSSYLIAVRTVIKNGKLSARKYVRVAPPFFQENLWQPKLISFSKEANQGYGINGDSDSMGIIHTESCHNTSIQHRLKLGQISYLDYARKGKNMLKNRSFSLTYLA